MTEVWKLQLGVIQLVVVNWYISKHWGCVL